MLTLILFVFTPSFYLIINYQCKKKRYDGVSICGDPTLITCVISLLDSKVYFCTLNSYGTLPIHTLDLLKMIEKIKIKNSITLTVNVIMSRKSV